MIACHCNIITEAEIEQTIMSMLDEDRWQHSFPTSSPLSRVGKIGPSDVVALARCAATRSRRGSGRTATVEDHLVDTPVAVLMPAQEDHLIIGGER